MGIRDDNLHRVEQACFKLWVVRDAYNMDLLAYQAVDLGKRLDGSAEFSGAASSRIQELCDSGSCRKSTQ